MITKENLLILKFPLYFLSHILPIPKIVCATEEEARLDRNDKDNNQRIENISDLIYNSSHSQNTSSAPDKETIFGLIMPFIMDSIIAATVLHPRASHRNDSGDHIRDFYTLARRTQTVLRTRNILELHLQRVHFLPMLLLTTISSYLYTCTYTREFRPNSIFASHFFTDNSI